MKQTYLSFQKKLQVRRLYGKASHKVDRRVLSLKVTLARLASKLG
jgi:hypothetical protein